MGPAGGRLPAESSQPLGLPGWRQRCSRPPGCRGGPLDGAGARGPSSCHSRQGRPPRPPPRPHSSPGAGPVGPRGQPAPHPSTFPPWLSKGQFTPSLCFRVIHGLRVQGPPCGVVDLGLHQLEQTHLLKNTSTPFFGTSTCAQGRAGSCEVFLWPPAEGTFLFALDPSPLHNQQGFGFAAFIWIAIFLFIVQVA